LGKLETNLLSRQIAAPESAVPGQVRPSDRARPWAYAMHESSARLPAVRPRDEKDDK
jgi:hypothetical protein